MTVQRIHNPGVHRPLKTERPVHLRPTHVPKIDWKQYFKEFCAEHGHWPIQDGGRLLFPDGWSCSASDYAGPYVAPPDNLEHLVQLKVKYWKRVLDIVHNDRSKLERDMLGLAEVQTAMNTELPVAHLRFDDEVDRYVRFHQRVDWQHLKMRLQWLVDEERTALEHLVNLGQL